MYDIVWSPRKMDTFSISILNDGNLNGDGKVQNDSSPTVDRKGQPSSESEEIILDANFFLNGKWTIEMWSVRHCYWFKAEPDTVVS